MNCRGPVTSLNSFKAYLSGTCTCHAARHLEKIGLSLVFVDGCGYRFLIFIAFLLYFTHTTSSGSDTPLLVSLR